MRPGSYTVRLSGGLGGVNSEKAGLVAAGGLDGGWGWLPPPQGGWTARSRSHAGITRTIILWTSIYYDSYVSYDLSADAAGRIQRQAPARAS